MLVIAETFSSLTWYATTTTTTTENDKCYTVSCFFLDSAERFDLALFLALVLEPVDRILSLEEDVVLLCFSSTSPLLMCSRSSIELDRLVDFSLLSLKLDFSFCFSAFLSLSLSACDSRSSFTLFTISFHFERFFLEDKEGNITTELRTSLALPNIYIKRQNFRADKFRTKNLRTQIFARLLREFRTFLQNFYSDD